MAKSGEHIIVPLIFTLFFLSSSLVSGFNTGLGAKTEISDVKENEEVQELGRFSVEEFNRRQGNGGIIGELVFLEVVEAQRQVVSGIKYYLKVNATQNGLGRVFDSVVVVKPWAHSKQLVNFSPSNTK
ncbi:hypothetical protein SLEP1_g37624 [Rubroshorea leprosula]|uniref:Cystatin domain-containing protein n=1 Tax=Rubroshorea leprosula TaxID=152421 RepID=A0AAV5KVS8_9ROSI|nr:hypothetical protein SLEP1_g37624 [Rubroshorea leprosula]